ncbi:MAG: hypothetical protein ABJK43_04880 [Lentilitoribacter sp.]
MSYIRLLCFSTALLFLPLATSAQTITIKSGEHGTFSRLVLNSSSLGPWRLAQQGNTHVLDFSSFSGQFNTSDVFRRIDHTRITNVSSRGSRLELKLACDCGLSVYNHSKELLVIDVKDKLNLPVPQKENKVVHFGKVKKLSFTSLILTAKNPVETSLPLQPISNTEARKFFSALSLMPFRNTSRSKSFPETRLQTLQGRLVHKFGTASSLGFLEPTKSAPKALLPPISNAPRSMSMTKYIEVNSELALVPPILPFLERHKKVSQDVGNICKSANELDVATWSDGEPLINQLSTLYANLYNPLGMQNFDISLQLVRLYLYFGFGAEAKHILNSHNDLASNWEELHFIADLLEEEENNWPLAPPEVRDCNGPITLWLSLSQVAAEPFMRSRQDEIVYELSRLPEHLRRIIAPKVSSRFLNVGDTNSAQAALRTLTRIDGQFENSAALQTGTMLIEANKPEKALVVFEAIRPSSVTAVKAVIKKTEIKIRENLNINDDDINLLDAYITEYKKTDLARELRLTRIRSLSKMGQFAQAFSETQAMDTTDQTELEHAIYSDLVFFSSDISFAENLLERTKDGPVSLEPSLSLAIADRLIELGFVTEGTKQLSNTHTTNEQDKFNEIRAKTALTKNTNTQQIPGIYSNQSTLESSLLEGEILSQLDRISNRELTAPEQTSRSVHEISKLISESSDTREILTKIMSSTEVEPREN